MGQFKHGEGSHPAREATAKQSKGVPPSDGHKVQTVGHDLVQRASFDESASLLAPLEALILRQTAAKRKPIVELHPAPAP